MVIDWYLSLSLLIYFRSVLLPLLLKLYAADAEALMEKLAAQLNAANLPVAAISEAQDEAMTSCVNMSSLTVLRNAMGSKKLKTITSRQATQEYNAIFAAGSDRDVCHVDVHEDLTSFTADLLGLVCQICTASANTSTGCRGLTDEEKLAGVKEAIPIDLAYSSDGGSITATSGITFFFILP